MTERKWAPLGSVSSGTMREEDLIPAFLDALRELEPDRAAAIEEDYADVLEGEWDEEQEGDGEGEREAQYAYCVEALAEALGDFAAPYCYFSSHPGDGADYGFWVSWESLEDDARCGVVLKIDAGDEWPDPLPEGTQYVLEITDHGNGTLYAPDHSEVWSVV